MKFNGNSIYSLFSSQIWSVKITKKMASNCPLACLLACLLLNWTAVVVVIYLVCLFVVVVVCVCARSKKHPHSLWFFQKWKKKKLSKKINYKCKKNPFSSQIKYYKSKIGQQLSLCLFACLLAAELNCCCCCRLFDLFS